MVVDSSLSKDLLQLLDLLDHSRKNRVGILISEIRYLAFIQLFPIVN